MWFNKTMPNLNHPEFGEITIYRSHQARCLKISVTLNGQLRVTVPKRLPLKTIQRTINSSQQEINQLFKKYFVNNPLHNGQRIGKSHTLIIQDSPNLNVTLQHQTIIVTRPPDLDLDNPLIRQQLQFYLNKAIKKEAKDYLPKRLAYLANQYGFQYNKIRLSSARTRWGSCSNDKTISLNIALMKLPLELIDYVLVHELTHTIEMNHSPSFWKLLAKKMPDYQQRRQALKKYDSTVN